MEVAYLLWFSMALVLLLFLHRAGRPTVRLPPGPMSLPVVGNMLSIGNKPHVSLAGLARIYGPVMSVRLGRQLNVVVTSPELFEQVFVKNDQALSSRSVPDAVRALGYNDVSVAWRPPYGRWRALRRLFNTQLFMATRLDAYKGVRERKVVELLAYIEECSQEGRSVDVGVASTATTLNLISTTVFSIDLFSPNSCEDIKDLVRKIMEEAGAPNISDFFPFLRVADLQGHRWRFGEYLKKMHCIFDDQIDRRLRSIVEGHHTEDDMLGAILAWRDPEDGESKLDRPTILALLVDLFTAGSDTSSSTVEWAMAELLGNTRCIEAATKEIRQTIGHKKRVEEQDISRLPYLAAVVKETLRLHPPIPLLLPRQAQSTVELGGYVVPAGTRVLMNVWAVGRDERVWTQPEKFYPERFLERKVEMKGSSFELNPFGGGRRICPGMPLALRMVHLMLASFLHGFNWKLPKEILPGNMNMDDEFGVISKGYSITCYPISCFSLTPDPDQKYKKIN